MNEWIWDGEMDYDWEDLSQLLLTTCSKFRETMLETTKLSPIVESRDLITEECMQRFESIVELLASNIKEGEYFQHEDLTNDSPNALKLNSWILLGSLTETTLQMFLAFYLDDYRNTRWQLWEDFKTEQAQPIIQCIQKLVSDGIIDTNMSRSFKEAIKDVIRRHTREHEVQKIMLDELIQLYTELDLFKEDELEYLKEIQSNRNGIHSFQSRTMGTWFDLQYSVRFLCYLLEWVLFHLPDIPDEVYRY